MDCEKIQIKIQEFHDGELHKHEEPFIFMHMSDCAECRNFFKGLNLMASWKYEENKNFPVHMDSNILNEIKHRSGLLKPVRKLPNFVSYAMGLAVVILTILIFRAEYRHRTEIEEAMQQIKEQSRQLRLIINSMPEIEVPAKPPFEVKIVSHKIKV